jgi:arylsulfatase A-like enzyme
MALISRSLFAMALSGIPAVLVGGAWWLLSRLPGAEGLVGQVAGRLGLAPSDAQEPFRPDVLALAARVSSFWCSLAVVLVVVRSVAQRLPRLQSEALSKEVLVLMVVAVVVAVTLGTWAGAPLAKRGLAWIDERLSLRRPLLGYGVLVLLPALVLLWPLWRHHRGLIRPLDELISLVAMGLLAGGLALSWSRWRPRSAARRKAVGWSVVALGAIGVAVTVGAYPRDGSAARSVEATALARLGADLLRRASDVDRDGSAALLAGGDCAPFDSTRGPAAVDVPGNGVDEDCDGKDAEPQVGLEPRFAQPQTGREQRLNVVWIVIDGVRADRTSVLGHRQDTTPYLATFARDSWLFSQAFSQSSTTGFSFASMFTGINPASLDYQPAKGTPRLSASHLTLAERLKELGYGTALLTTGWVTRTYPPLLQGYDQVIVPEAVAQARQWSERNSPIVTSQAIEVIEQLADRPFFVTVFYHDPHYPYVKHAEVPDFGGGDLGRYDSDVAFADLYAGMLLSHLRHRQPLWDRTMVIVTSDHGEEFGERGGKHHAQTCHVESTHVPLVVRIPGEPARRIDGPVALVDIAATVVEAVGARRDGGLQGHSLLVPGRGSSEGASDRPIFCTIVGQFEQARFFRRSVRAGGYALMHDVRSGIVQLYDTRADGRERHDLASLPAQRARIDELKALLSLSPGPIGDSP